MFHSIDLPSLGQDQGKGIKYFTTYHIHADLAERHDVADVTGESHGPDHQGVGQQHERQGQEARRSAHEEADGEGQAARESRDEFADKLRPVGRLDLLDSIGGRPTQGTPGERLESIVDDEFRQDPRNHRLFLQILRPDHGPLQRALSVTKLRSEVELVAIDQRRRHMGVVPEETWLSRYAYTLNDIKKAAGELKELFDKRTPPPGTSPTEMLRRQGVVGKFVEFYGEGVAAVPLANRATSVSE